MKRLESTSRAGKPRVRDALWRRSGLSLTATASLSSPRLARDRHDHAVIHLSHGNTLFIHDHHFHEVPGGTRMVDVLDYAAPLGPLGRIAEGVAVTRHLRRLLTERAQLLRDVAQGWDDDDAAKFSISG